MSSIGSTEEVEVKKSPKNKCLKGLKDNLFTILTLIGVAVGFGIGFGVATTKPDAVVVEWIKMPGTIYIRLLQLTILPVIAANIIVVMAAMDPKKNGRVGISAICFIFGMDLLSGAIGVLIAALMKPGVKSTPTVRIFDDVRNATIEAPVTTSDVFADLFLNIFPDNIIGIAIFQTQTIREYPNYPNTSTTARILTNLMSTDMIGLIFTSIVFGIAARAAGETGRVFIDFFQALSDVVLVLMNWFLQLTPVGVCFMVAGSVVGLDDVAGTFQQLGLFMATVLVALSVHMLIQIAIYTVISFRNPFRLMFVGFKVWFLSFITTAPLIVIPEMIVACDKFGIKKEISRFVIPLSAALKGDGSGAFQAVACVFVAQSSGFDISIGTYVIIALLTGFATLAIPNVPSSSIIIVITILKSLGIDATGVSLLYAIEWFMDRCRSGSIGLGHLFTAGVTQSIAVGRRTEHQDDDGETDEFNSEDDKKPEFTSLDDEYIAY